MTIDILLYAKAIIGLQVLTLVSVLFGFCRSRAKAAPAAVSEVLPDAFCCHCGRAISRDPVMQVATQDKSYMVYNCSACSGETLMAIPPDPA